MSDSVGAVDQTYPTTTSVTREGPPQSNGSFGPVFIILSIILVVSLVACVVGRICSKRQHKSKPKGSKPNQATLPTKLKGVSAPRMKHDFHPKVEDIEFGFDKPIPGSKVAATEGFNGGFKPPSHHGEPRGQVRFADEQHMDFKPPGRPGRQVEYY